MPPLEREVHEGFLNELMSPETTETRKVAILQELRTDYTDVLENHKSLSESVSKLQEDNNDLITSNSKLFRQLGIQGDPEAQNKEDKKTFSETIKLEDLLK